MRRGGVHTCPPRAGASRGPRLVLVECCQHPLEGDDAITAVEELLDLRPVDSTVDPAADPEPAAVWRDEEAVLLQEVIDLRRRQAEGNGRSLLNHLERGERLVAGAEVRVSPRGSLGGFGQREAETPQPLDYGPGVGAIC